MVIPTPVLTEGSAFAAENRLFVQLRKGQRIGKGVEQLLEKKNKEKKKKNKKKKKKKRKKK